jgi:hypothetical protein
VKTVTITVEDGFQAEKILNVLNEAEEEGFLDFAFGAQVTDLDGPAPAAPDLLLPALRALVDAMEPPRSRKATAAWDAARSLLATASAEDVARALGGAS